MLPNGNQQQNMQNLPRQPPVNPYYSSTAPPGPPPINGSVTTTNPPNVINYNNQQVNQHQNQNPLIPQPLPQQQQLNYAHHRPHQPLLPPLPPNPNVGQRLPHQPPGQPGYPQQPQQVPPQQYPQGQVYPQVPPQPNNIYPRAGVPPSSIPSPQSAAYPPQLNTNANLPPTGYPQTYLQQPSYQQQTQPPPSQQPQGYPPIQNNKYPISQQPLQQQQQQGYQQQNGEYYNNGVGDLSNQLGGLSVTQQGFNKLWGIDHIDLLKNRHVLPPYGGVKPPDIRMANEYWRDKNCSPDLFRCTLTKIPETKNLLQKSRLPLGLLIHPFKDLTQLPVIQCSTIVRCRSCRTYINPFVYFVDTRRWKCNLCFRVNDLPEEFQYDPLTKTYGDPMRRPEVRSGTIEFLAPADYMVRPPQAAVYLFILESTSTAIDTGYLKIICDSLLESLDALPGDSRTQIGFITYNSSVQFYNLSKEFSQPNQLVVCDIDDMFVPCPDGLLVPLNETKDNVKQLLRTLPGLFLNAPVENRSCLGAAVQIAQKLLSPIGGRITIFQCTLPTLGPGSLPNRGVDAQQKSFKDLSKDLNPSTDFYKRLALECSSQYIAVDCFFINNTYADIASVSCISKHSGGSIYRFNNLQSPNQKLLLENAFNRYLTRKIGFEAVMRVRCSRGMSIHTFHGNLFVRSTDLLSLPNCNPDAGFGMQVSIDEDLRDFQNVCFQAALLYTSSKGERRIRVHTLCLPVASNVNDIIQSADQQCIIGLLSKMGVDRSLSTSIQDAREAFINACVDILSAYFTTQNATPSGLTLIAPQCLQMLPTYIHALLRSIGFRSDSKPALDDRVHFMNQMKSLPLYLLIQTIYPDLYPIHQVLSVPLYPSSSQLQQQQNHQNQEEGENDEEEEDPEDSEDQTPQFPLLNLCSDRIDANGCYLMDQPELILIYVNRSISSQFCQEVFNCNSFQHVNEMNEFPELDTISSIRIRNFVTYLQSFKPYTVPVRIIREDSRERLLFVNNLIEDRGDPAPSNPSYYEFLQQIKNLVK